MTALSYRVQYTKSHAGNAVTIAPQTMKLTTQQAADPLGVSRPTVVRLITGGTLPAGRIGNHHRLLTASIRSDAACAAPSSR